MLQVEASGIGTLYLDPTPFAKGGEGLLHEVRAPKAYQNYVVKLYYEDKRNQERADKIDYLTEHPPIFVEQEEQQLAWPKAKVLERGAFAGFLMPRVAGQPLEILCTAKIPAKYKKDWQRFDFSKAEALALRQRVCFNIAVALQRLHASRQYAVVDLKPDNILIQPNGIVSIVDLDSIEVFEEGLLKFAAPVATPEYSPPEFFVYYEDWGAGRECWDRFSMGVIFYKLLIGLHPFAATAKAPYDQTIDLASKIEKGLFVHQDDVQIYLEKVPDLHRNFKLLSTVLQDAFMQTFAFGAKQADMRTTAAEWCWVFAEDITELKEKKPLLKPLVSDFPEFDFSPIPSFFKENRLTDFQKQLLELKASKQLTKAWWKGSSVHKIEHKSKPPVALVNFLKSLAIRTSWQNFWAHKYIQWEEKQQAKYTQLIKIKNQLKENLKAEALKQKENLKELNRAVAQYAQKHRLAKRQHYQDLQEHPIWKLYRGKQLDAKLLHLEQKLRASLQDLNANKQLSVRKLETASQREVERLEQAYYQRLKLLETQAKDYRKALKGFSPEAYQKHLTESNNNSSLESELEASLDQLQQDYFHQIQGLERDQQLKLSELTEELRLKGVDRLQDFKEKKRKIIAQYQEKLSSLSTQHQVEIKLLTEKHQKLEGEKVKTANHSKRQEDFTTAFKKWKQSALNRIQKELMATKVEEEQAFIKNRQSIVNQLQEQKEKLTYEIKQQEKNLQLEKTEHQKILKKLWQNYLQSLELEDRLFEESKEQIIEVLELEKTKVIDKIKSIQAQWIYLQEEEKRQLEAYWEKLFKL
jgi:serine/threonine protein kinase